MALKIWVILDHFFLTAATPVDQVTFSEVDFRFDHFVLSHDLLWKDSRSKISLKEFSTKDSNPMLRYGSMCLLCLIPSLELLLQIKEERTLGFLLGKCILDA